MQYSCSLILQYIFNPNIYTYMCAFIYTHIMSLQHPGASHERYERDQAYVTPFLGLFWQAFIRIRSKKQAEEGLFLKSSIFQWFSRCRRPDWKKSLSRYFGNPDNQQGSVPYRHQDFLHHLSIEQHALFSDMLSIPISIEFRKTTIQDESLLVIHGVTGPL